MVIKLADNIYSPLGVTTHQNYQAVIEGRCALRQYSLPDGSPYTASLFPEDQRGDGKYTFFEQLCITSASDAIARAGIDPASPRVRFFLSTTKGNVHLLAKCEETSSGCFDSAAENAERAMLGTSASIISKYFGNPNTPVVVSNACISGLSAQIAAVRSIEAGLCDTAVVIGCDTLSEFIISGFHCLHALSPTQCRPFDRDRCGLNLGEAAATIVYGNSAAMKPNSETWTVQGCAMCNDANHISGPSRTGEGSYRCLQTLDIDPSDLAFISVHGTSTLYNDEMESIAIDRAGLADVPLFSLKGIYGHTLGAAGVLETVLAMQAVEHGVVFGTRGFENIGVSRQVNVSAELRATDKRSFVKLLSGFGGCNAAMKFCYSDNLNISDEPCELEEQTYQHTIPSIRITPTADELVELYRKEVGDYPKFFKMDPLSRLGFIASELLLKKAPKADYGVLLFNRSSSMVDDIAFQQTIHDRANWFPSPALFVYTLPNIVTGEIAIRNHFLTETNFMVLDAPRADIMAEQIAIAAQYGPQLSGWCETAADGTNTAALIAVPQHSDKATVKQTLSDILF